MPTQATALVCTLIAVTAIGFYATLLSIEQSAKTDFALTAAKEVAQSSVSEPVNTAQSDDVPQADAPAEKGLRPRLDLAFCIDTTGSMEGEILMVKTKVKSVVAKLSSGQAKPIVRVGLVAYRDKDDDYVTRVFPFSEDIDKVVQDISNLTAEGGGDRPEAVDIGLHTALNQLEWDGSKHTAKLLFLIGDAGPHTDTHKYDWKKDAQNAGVRGIRINTIGCDGLDTQDGTPVFKKIASLTNGNYETLSYHQEIVDAAGNRTNMITSGGVTYKVNKDGDWKEGADALVAKGMASYASSGTAEAPSLQGATNGTIGPQGADATFVAGVNTAGVVRSENNLDHVMLEGAQNAVNEATK